VDLGTLWFIEDDTVCGLQAKWERIAEEFSERRWTVSPASHLKVIRGGKGNRA
jgi:hypothetical protein